MAAVYAQEQPVTLTVPVADAMGNEIAPSAANWVLFDEDGAEVTSGSVVDPNPVSKKIVITITGEHNVAPVSTAARELVVTFTVPGGVVEQREIYLIQRSSPLGVMENSFVTYPEALALRQGFGGMFAGWDTSDKSAQCAALIHAYSNLAQLTYKVGWSDSSRYAGYENGADRFCGRVIKNISLLDQSEFQDLPSNFRKALKRAQIVEADTLLGGDTLASRRRDGVISETIGESSMMFSTKPYLELPVCRAAYRELNGYIYRRIGVFRGA